MNQDLFNYTKEFVSKLIYTVDQSLNINNPEIANEKVSSIYSLNIITSSANAGYELNLPAEVAIGFMVIAEGTIYEKKNNSFANLFSIKKQKLYNDHNKIVTFIEPTVAPYYNNDISKKFYKMAGYI